MSSFSAPPSAKRLVTDGGFFVKNLIRWYSLRDRQLPWRALWAIHKNPWHIWVSEIMLQQTVIKAVLPVYSAFIEKYPDHHALAKATTEQVRLSVRGLGYYRRFDALHRASILLSTQNRPLPSTYDQWLELPGIGPYTAAAIASITLNEPQGVVDGNVERVLCRLLDIRTAPNLPALKKIFKAVMDEWCRLANPGDLNQAVMELGQIVCVPSSPSCVKCPLKTQCQSFAVGSQALSPAAKEKKPFVDELLSLTIYTRNGKIGLTRRDDSSKFLKNTLGFKTERISQTPIRAVAKISHTITRHKITAAVLSEAWRDQDKLESSITWLSPAEVEPNLVSNLDRKAWIAFLRSSPAKMTKTS